MRRPSLKASALVMAVSAALLMASGLLRPRPVEDRAQESDQWLRERLGILDDARHAEAFNQEVRRLAERDGTFTTMALLDGVGWEALGPAPLNLDGFNRALGPHSGRFTSLSSSAQNRDLILAGADGGGLWRTTDGGANWRSVADRECSSYVTSVIIDPANFNIAYAGARCGLLRSLDAGVSWSRIGTITPAATSGDPQLLSVLSIAIDSDTVGSSRGTILLIGTGLGLYRSTDSGATATRLNGFTNISSIRQSPTQRNRFYALNNAGATTTLYRSDDKGATWRPLPLPLASALRMSVSAQNGETVYVTHRLADQTTYTVSSSTDGGSTWNTFAAPASETGTGGRADVVPLGSNLLFHGVSYWLRRGDAWSSVAATTVHADGQWAEVLGDNDFFLTSDGGPYRAVVQDGSVRWQSIAGELSTFQIYPGVTIDETNPDTILMGTQDNGTLLRRDGRWQRIMGADGGWTAFDAGDPNTLYGGEQQPYGTFSCTRTAASTSCRSASPKGIDFTRTSFLPPMVRSESSPRTLYYGTSQVYKSTDGAQNWVAVSDHFPYQSIANCSTAQSERITVRTLAVRPGSSETILAGTSTGAIWRSVDSGATWDRTNAPACYAVNDLYVDAVTGAIFAAYARPTTYKSTARDYGNVLRSTDNGATWQNVSGDLPNLAALAVAYEPVRRLLFVGTESGVYVSDPEGRNASPLQAGMPIVTIQDLVFDKTRDQLYVATWGRGMYKMRLPAR